MRGTGTTTRISRRESSALRAQWSASPRETARPACILTFGPRAAAEQHLKWLESVVWYCADRACGATRDELPEYLALRAHLWDKGTVAAASIHDERVELAEAGLPTTFGPAKRGRRRRRRAGGAQPPVPRAVIDDIVEAEYEEDGRRYPARVLTVRRSQRGSIRVRFLGYGNEAWVSRVWPLTEELFAIWADWVRADERGAAEKELDRLRQYSATPTDTPTDDTTASPYSSTGPNAVPSDSGAAAAGDARGTASAVVAGSVSMSRYWDQRYRYFSRFDEGVTMDEEGCVQQRCICVWVYTCVSMFGCACVCV